MTEEKKPLISVLMGVYNCKERSMLERSVRSIVEQTYPNWELILCDDGSTNAALLWMQNLLLGTVGFDCCKMTAIWAWLGR